MRIVIYGINFSPEAVGVGKYSGELASWLAARGHEIRVITAPPFNPQWHVWSGYSSWKYHREYVTVEGVTHGSSGPSTSEPAIEVFRCPTWVPRDPRGSKRLLHLLSFALSSCVPAIRQLAWRPDIVLLVEPTLLCALPALMMARWSGAKSWLHVQDFEVDAAFELGDFSYPRLRKCALTIERKLLQSFDRVSTISNRMLELLAIKGVDPTRAILFPNWVNVNDIYPLRRPSAMRATLGIFEETIVALYSGSMGNKQGLDLLVDVARRLSHRRDLLFVLCGEGAYREVLLRETSAMANVRLLGLQPVEALNDLLNLADIHLLPQRADAADLVMPSKLTGMLASGKPVIATANPGTQLASVVSGRGIVVPPGDPNSFVTAILELSNSVELRTRLGANARDYAVSQMGLDEILQKFEQELASVYRNPGESLMASAS